MNEFVPILACIPLAIAASLLFGPASISERAAIDAARAELARLGYDLTSLVIEAREQSWRVLRGWRQWDVAFRAKEGRKAATEGRLLVSGRTGRVLATVLGK
jgi:hypothetical protein